MVADRRSRRRRPVMVGAALVLMLMGQLGTPRGGAAATRVVANPAPIAILDAAAADPYPSPIAVSGLTGTVTRVNVALRALSHTSPVDIDVLLVGPGGQTVLLMSDVGGSVAIADVTLTFDDAAPPLPVMSQLTSGTFRPTNRADMPPGNDLFPAPAPAGPYGTVLTAFNGTDPNGTWQLFVRDDRTPHTGTIAGGWCLAITTDQPGPATVACTPTLTVTTTGQGTVTSAPAGIDCGTTCTAPFEFDTIVTLSAVPAAGFIFAGWSGGCTGTGGCAVTMTTDLTVSATFSAIAPGTVALTVTTAGAGSGTVTSVPAGIDCGTDCTEVYPSGTVVTLTATAAPSFVFAGWSGGGCSGTDPCMLTMTQNLSVTATFGVPPGTLALTVVRAGSGLGTVTSAPVGIACGTDCAEAYPANTLVTLSVTGRRGSTFGGWSGGGCGGTGPCAVTVTTNTVLTAPFDPPTDRPLIVIPETDGPVLPLDAPATFAWLGPAGAVQYGFEFTGPNRAFANPIGSGPDPVNGFGGAGGGILIPATSLSVTVPPTIPAGVYQVRVVGLSATGAIVGRFSDAVPLLVGGLPGGQPTIASPGEGAPVPRGSPVMVAWTPVAGAVQYLFAFTGGPDPGMIGGAFIVPDAGFTAVVPSGIPAGTYRVQVIGLTQTGAPLGQFSDTLTLTIQ